MKKILPIIVYYFYLSWQVFAWAPPLECSDLIWCWDNDKPAQVIWEFIWEFIKYIAIIAIIAVMISGIFYLISAWDEEKVKKWKKWIIWSIVWVILSVSAWFIVQSINKLTF